MKWCEVVNCALVANIRLYFYDMCSGVMREWGYFSKVSYF